MLERIGFIGLGIMGKPMARNLLKAGYSVTVYNRSRPAVDELVEEGAAAAESPQEIAKNSEVVITMLPDGPDVEEAVLGLDGLLAGANRWLLIIDMSTISPGAAKRLAEAARERGVGMLDAPVSGGDKGAIAGTLSIMVGGNEDDFKRAMPIFEAVGKTITYCGSSGAGQTVKACNQVAVALHYAAASEALVLGAKAGVAPEVILKVLGGGLAQSRVMDMRGPAMSQHQFTPGFKARLHSKDLRIIMETAREYGATLPFAALADQLYTALVQNGGGELDHSALLTVIEKLSNGSIGDTQ
ncbi:MAG: 2-hydroxy-3-oxopropionate reductase [Chloroflexi bacterium]|nr:2-hydroxy-3-oxopropionate reductase [Chloroflexota bacterium]MBN9396929.1 2-hydroxy-3-oxopropionate reductase [Candidatus Melainabacteria bacterium]OJV92952.1 MAG: 2-hydroxy-3-oxopropionate reductase [Chloroflexi bacterium 54-19]